MNKQQFLPSKTAPRDFPKTPHDFPLNAHKTTHKTTHNVHEDRLKLFMSITDQPIPDITPNTDIHSQFLFFFNDPDLVIGKSDNENGLVSVLHEESFIHKIERMYSQWVKSLREEENSNFISFVEHWLRQSPQLIVIYEQYDEIVSQCVQQHLGNVIPFISHRLTALKKKVVEIVHKESPKQQQPMKLMQCYFNHYCKNTKRKANDQTFDEINQSLSALDIGQWVKIIRQLTENRFVENISENKQLIVNKSANSIRNIKILFKKYCKNQKKMNFEQFYLSLQQLFKQMFGEEKAIESGLAYIRMRNNEELADRLREIGVFVPKEITHMPIKKKNYNAISSRYMNANANQLDRTYFSHSHLKETNVNTQVKLQQMASSNNNNNNYRMKTPKKSNPVCTFEEDDDTDEFLKQYYNKSSAANVLKRIDERIEKIGKKML